MSLENTDDSEFVGCGGNCACAARRVKGECATSQADFFSSVALASELLCEPGDEFINNVRSLWSALAPGKRVFAAGLQKWAKVDAELNQWFCSNQVSTEFALQRYTLAFEGSEELRAKMEAISELLYKVAPLFARESYFKSRGDATGAATCVAERTELLRTQMLPLLELSPAEEDKLNTPWFRASMEWTRFLVRDLI